MDNKDKVEQIQREIATPAADYSFTVTAPSEPGTYVVDGSGVFTKLFDAGPLDLTKPLLPAAQKITDDLREAFPEITEPAASAMLNPATGE